MQSPADPPKNTETPCLVEIKLFVPEDLARAFHRCLWLQVNETGNNRTDLMREAIRDFLVKHGC